MRSIRLRLLFLMLIFGASLNIAAQTTATISGIVVDEKQGAIASANITARNVETNVSRTTQTDDNGRYRFENVPVGAYEVTVEAAGFAKYVQTGITLALNQPAVVDVTMKPGGVAEIVTVTENASLLNTTSAEVGTRFDSRRISELPLTPNRNIYNIALSAAGVSQLGSGQQAFAGGGVGSTSGVSFSANGGRIRSNNFMIDGQDNNDFGVAGSTVPLNNPDLIQEVRLVTNQFVAEYGRNSSSVFNAITKSGTNDFHGSAFWFHNDNQLNARNNVDENSGLRDAPLRIENQLGGTLGGPLHLPRFGEGGPKYINGRDRTFFFLSMQRWWDRQINSGITLRGAPTVEGRQILQSAAGTRPQVAALLRFLPAAQGPCARPCESKRFTLGGQTYTVPLGELTTQAPVRFNDWQSSFRVDHRITENQNFNARYIYQDSDSSGFQQATPPGLSQGTLARNQALNLSLTSILSSRAVNEVRAAYLRHADLIRGDDPRAEGIPSIELTDLGLTGFNAAANRTAIGLAVNLPQFSFRQTYQVQDNFSYTVGNHAMKFGVDIRRNQLKQFFVPTIRGRLVYSTLQRFIDDVADSATINFALPGGQQVIYYDWHDFFGYAQDEWRVRPNFTLTIGLRYETPGQPITDLVQVNNGIVAAAGNDPRYRFFPVPKRDKNNFQPRIGFNWNPRTGTDGFFGLITGGDKFVLRGGYARTHDYAFTNIASNIASSFPFLGAAELRAVQQPGSAPGVNNAYVVLPTITSPVGLNPNELTRTVVGEDFRSPTTDSFNLEVQREVTRDMIFRVGYVATKGNGLFQTINGNPTLPSCVPTTTNNCRANPNLGVIRLRANAASSIYHSMQASLDKRLTRGFSAGFHYTWSAFIDTASEIFNPSGAEVAIAQDSFNLRADRARSGYDRPHRFSGNFVYEFPFLQDQKGFVGRLLGGWQVNSFFTFQSGAPFTPLNGSDPTGTLAGISGLVGNAIRPNLNTNLDLSNMTIEEILAAGGSSLFRTLRSNERIGNAGRNILRADGINNIDFGVLKNTRISENHRFQIRADFFNLTNTRDFGIPEGRVNNPQFLNQWGTNGGNRRVIVGLRYVF